MKKSKADKVRDHISAAQEILMDLRDGFDPQSTPWKKLNLHIAQLAIVRREL